MLDETAVVVADAHVSRAHGNHEAFFQMLSLLAKRGLPVFFMGDIFDLWVSLPRYEDPLQKRFLDWCSDYKSRRQVVFVEGNREFFVAEQHKTCFSQISADGCRLLDGRLLLVHGDQINRRDRSYLRWRRLTKNPVAKTITRWLPLGPGIAERLKTKLKRTNRAFRIYFPEASVCDFAERQFAQGVETVLVGHFHHEFAYEGQAGGRLYVLPDWFATGKVGLYHRGAQKLQNCHWRELGK